MLIIRNLIWSTLKPVCAGDKDWIIERIKIFWNFISIYKMHCLQQIILFYAVNRDCMKKFSIENNSKPHGVARNWFSKQGKN